MNTVNNNKTAKPKPSQKRTLAPLSLVGLFSCATLVATLVQAQPQTIEEKASYAIGVDFAKSFKTQNINLESESVIQGIRDGLNDSSVLSQTEMEQALNALKSKIIAQQQKLQLEQSTKNKIAGEAFLAANKNQDGVITLKSGLQYKVIKSGQGASPKATDKVTTHYRGTLIDGTEFDSSYSRNAPATFAVNRVISGWTEALQLMHEGDQWQLFIPANLAYGKRAVGDKIQADSTLIFDIELLKVN